jgi:hypothetical protein
MPAPDKSSDTDKLPDTQGAVQQPSKSTRDRKRVDEPAVSTDSSAGEEDPGAGLDDPETRDAIQGEAQAHTRQQQQKKR